jgi:hypothetical protein
MRTFLILTFLVPSAMAQIPVTDVGVFAQAIKEVALVAQQLEQAKTELERLGDPKNILPKSASDLIDTLSKTGEGKTLDEIQAVASSAEALLYDAHGLFRAPGSQIRRADGATVPRDPARYRKFDAITQARTTLEVVFDDTETRRQEVRQQIRRTLGRLQSAGTQSEVLKLQGILTAQNAELAAVDRERDAAASRVLVQQIENQTDAERQETARREERIAAFQQAQERLYRILTPATTPVRIPNPARR